MPICMYIRTHNDLYVIRVYAYIHVYAQAEYTTARANIHI